MAYKERTESDELLALRSLNSRMELPAKDKFYYRNLEKGFTGEKLFDALTEKLESDCLVLNDLELKLNNTTFQIDTTIIFSGVIYAADVKYYEGDHFYQGDSLYKVTTPENREVTNPILQIRRSETCFRQLLKNLGCNLPIHSNVVFNNPAFTLYQSPLDSPIVHPTQVSTYIKHLNAVPSKLTDKQYKLADRLAGLHYKDPQYWHLPEYKYEALKKGMVCSRCRSFSMSVSGKKLVCRDCGCEEKVNAAVLRSVREFRMLFPKVKITTRVIHEWCQIVDSKKWIRRILSKNFKESGTHRWSYFE